jgi:protein-export membrane protein SecD
LNGAYFKYAQVGQSQTWQPIVSILFDDKGKDIFCNLTEQFIGKQMAIFVGWKLMTAPVIRDKICGWSAQIDGSFDIKWARTLADDLNSGALPAPLLLSHEETIAPSLWQNALNAALLAWLFGILIVYFVLMLLYGWKKANIALIGIISFLVFLLAIIKILWIVSSLSGIAAIVLSLWMAVDANVLMYERIREEQKAGKWIASAIEDGYERSRAPIRDGNITTWIIWALLFLVGVNIFKWFGTMMLINMLLILFVITPLTRKLLRLFYNSK